MQRSTLRTLMVRRSLPSRTLSEFIKNACRRVLSCEKGEEMKEDEFVLTDETIKELSNNKGDDEDE